MNLTQKRALYLLFLFVLALDAPHVFGATFYEGVAPNNLPWPGGIVPYVFDFGVTLAQQQVYLSGMREWELAANIKFIPRTNQTHYVILRFGFQQGTNTYIASDPPVMTIDNLSGGQICHETGHLLGFQHEHVRTDRDSFIVVHFNNIVTNSMGEQDSNIVGLYLVDTNSTFFGAYDFESVMHYGRRLFSVDPDHLDVIEPLPAYRATYYNRIGNFAISPADRAGAAYLYGPLLTALTNVVTTTSDGGFGSLRAALYYANDHPGTTIRFNIPTTDPGFSNDVFTIYSLGELPSLVANGTIIDATTQPGYADRPIVALDGSRVIPEVYYVSGLRVFAANCMIRGLALNNFSDSGIHLLYNDCASNRVEGCFLGIALNGTNTAPNGYQGVNIQGGAHANIIGGTNASQRNVISGNTTYGITINETNTDANVILGNYIGLDALGNFSVTNGFSGIGMYGGARSNVIGGTSVGARNVISGNADYGIFAGDPNTIGFVIQGNFIGTDASGSNAVANGAGGIGIFYGANSATIGGSSGAARNIISGNQYSGIWLAGAGVSNNVVQGNFIGTTSDGMSALSNNSAGIVIATGASSNLIGGNSSAGRNIISGNKYDGVVISDSGTTGNQILGNYIGVNKTASAALPNNYSGISIFSGASANIIGTSDPNTRNILSGNGAAGVFLSGSTTRSNAIHGNYIGTDPGGLNAISNGSEGLVLVAGANNNLVGGTTAGAGNVICASAYRGIFMADPGTSGNIIQGNYIGLGANGLEPLGNGYEAIAIFNGASSNLIGGASSAARNILSGNGTRGIFLADTNTTANLIQGNYIGVAADGVTARSNNLEGIIILNGAHGNVIGLDTAGAGAANLIANSGLEGVAIYNSATTGNVIRGNSIFANGRLGINLIGGLEDFNAVTANDSTDSDSGPNNLQNYPLLTEVSATAIATTIRGTLNSNPGRSFLIDVYRNASADASGYGEGQIYVGSAGLNSDGGGNGTFTLIANGNFAAQFFTATATDTTTGDTSEFSAAVLATNNPTPVFVGPFTYEPGSGTFSFSLSLVTNYTYRVQTATNLSANPIVWVDLTNFFAVTSLIQIIDRTATNAMRFYRAVTL